MGALLFIFLTQSRRAGAERRRRALRLGEALLSGRWIEFVKRGLALPHGFNLKHKRSYDNELKFNPSFTS